jgi:hypothetical protein
VSPPYRAVIECVPTERLAVENVATPLALSADEPRVVPPSRNVTVPVGVPAPEDGLTVAVNVTCCPRTEGFSEDVSEVVVLIKLLTVWVRTDDVLPV